MPAVYNKRANAAPKEAIYIGRGSPWGNPFKIGEHGDRAQVIARFVKEVLPRLDLEPLRGKDLVCWCSPSACHGDEILKALSGTASK